MRFVLNSLTKRESRPAEQRLAYKSDGRLIEPEMYCPVSDKFIIFALRKNKQSTA